MTIYVKAKKANNISRTPHIIWNKKPVQDKLYGDEKRPSYSKFPAKIAADSLLEFHFRFKYGSFFSSLSKSSSKPKFLRFIIWVNKKEETYNIPYESIKKHLRC